MRINKFVASATGLSRRAADVAIEQGRVLVNDAPAQAGQAVSEADEVRLDGRKLNAPKSAQTIILNKPRGYVVSRNGQGSRTIYDLLPPELHHLKPVGRLDKDSSGLLLLTNDGQLAQKLTHPSHQKTKLYEVELDKPLSRQHFRQITETGVKIDDKTPSKFGLAANSQQKPGDKVPGLATSKQPKTGSKASERASYFLPETSSWQVTLTEGRNRQIRRTFAALGYNVTRLHRTRFGRYALNNLPESKIRQITS